MATKKVNEDGIVIDDKYINGYTKFDLNNVECHWCHLLTPDTAFGNNKYCLEMHLEEPIGKQLKSLGFSVKEKTLKDGKVIPYVLKAKKEVVTKSGDKQDPPSVVGPDGRTPFTDQIGNGSILNLKLSCKAWPIKGKYQMSVYIDKVQVAVHVPFEAGFSDVSGDSSNVPF